MAIKEILEQNTDQIIEATELLKVLSDREGMYVWEKYGKPSELPNGYTAVEYIKASGTQRIDTGISYDVNNEYVIETECYLTSGTIGWDGGGQFGVYSSGHWYVGGNPTTLKSSEGKFSKITFTIEAGVSSNTILKIEQDGVTETITREHDSLASYATVNFPIFATGGKSGISLYANGAVKSFKIKVNQVVVRDYVACVTSSGEVGLYDRTNNTFLSNSGSGTFETNGNEYFIYCGYVVADNETAYPDGGTQDGYYYERVKESAKYGMFFDKVDATGMPIEAHFKFINIAKNMFYLATNGNSLASCEKLIIEAQSVGEYSFRDFLYDFKGKLKLNATNIEHSAFYSFGSGASQAPMVWLSSKCVTVKALTNGAGVFNSAKNTTKLYCEPASQPSTWVTRWNYYNSSSNLTTTWGVTEEQFDAL